MAPRRQLLSACLGALLLAACQTTDEFLAAFHGQDRAYLLGRMGPPDLKEPDGRGGEIWIYQERQVSAAQATETETTEKNAASANQQTTTRKKSLNAPAPRVRLVFKSFYLDANGVIYDTAHGARYLQR